MAAKGGAVVPTLKDPPLPAELGGREQIDVSPAKNTVLEPLGLATKQTGPDEWTTQYLISPFEMVSIKLNSEGKALLLSQLTGGIVVPS